MGKDIREDIAGRDHKDVLKSLEPKNCIGSSC